MSTAAPAATAADKGPVPKDWIVGLTENIKFDIVSGLIIFLIALPLCLAIAIASGAPPIAGVITGFIGGIVGSLLSGSHLTINGPAAGMIVVVLGVVSSLADNPADITTGFKYALAVGVVCGLIQVVLGFVGAGAMTNMFNLSVVHGMLAGIGCIVMGKQIHVALGVTVKGDMLTTYAAIPSSFMNMNTGAAVIGGLAILIMALWPKVPKLSKVIPAPLLVIFVAVPLAGAFNLSPDYLVKVPLNFMESFTLPDWSKVATGIFWKGVFVYVFVASLESLLTASAVDKLDPWKRRSNMNRELVGKGVANTLCGFIGGLPMIAEVVRSKANIMNNARTRWSNFFHGLFLLLAVALIPAVLNKIPLAALAGMLVFIGFNLAHPREFKHVAHIGKEEIFFMVVTVLGVVFVDLLWGVIGGMVLALVVNLMRGVPISRIFKAAISIDTKGDTITIKLQSAAGFNNFFSIRKALDQLPRGKKIVIDYSEAGFIDHTVRERLHDFEIEYADGTGSVTYTGMQHHKPSSSHPLGALVRA